MQLLREESAFQNSTIQLFLGFNTLCPQVTLLTAFCFKWINFSGCLILMEVPFWPYMSLWYCGEKKSFFPSKERFSGKGKKAQSKRFKCQNVWNYDRCFPGGASGKEVTCQCRRYKRHKFDPWLGKIPWRRR